jgi:predicted O-methyltransferase YrrM
MAIIRKINGTLKAIAKSLSGNTPPTVFPPSEAIPSDLSKNVITKLGSVNGYFNEDDCMHFYLVLQMQKMHGMTGNIFEIGSYFGRSTGLLALCLAKNERLVVCDAFESDTKDQYADRPSISDLKESIRTIVDDFDFSQLDVHSCYSADLSLPDESTFRFAHIDGGHDEETAYNDICYAATRMKVNGIIAVDDYEHPNWPGVTIAVNRFLAEHHREFQVIADMNRHVAKGRKIYLMNIGS